MKTLQIIVECDGDITQESLISKLGVVKYSLPIINSYVLEVPEESLKELKDIKHIKSIYHTANITAQMYEERKTVHANFAHSQGLTGKGVTIAILDTGIASVDDLSMPKNRIIGFKDIINGNLLPYDDNGHGTHVAGIRTIH